MSVAVVTMVYNEPFFLPLWIKHYAGQVGLPHCYVIDHGSDDGTTQGYDGINFIRLARSPQDDHKRRDLVTTIVNSLLNRYDAVIYTDADEILFADPRLYPSLPAFAAANRLPVVTAYGFELYHLTNLQPAIDLAKPILQQRQWVRFNAAMCKPLLVRRPVNWVPGFHCTDEPVAFGSLYLFHLRWFDHGIAARRLAKTRGQPWADPEACPWQRWPDAENEKFIDWYNRFERIEDCDLLPQNQPLKAVAERFLASQRGRENDLYKVDLHIPIEQMWQLPPAFLDVF
jgi:hypothetical protein